MPYEMDRSGSWKERIYFMMSRLQDKAMKKKLRSLEVILLSSVILIIWMIFTAPTIVFVLLSETDSTINEVANFSHLLQGVLAIFCDFGCQVLWGYCYNYSLTMLYISQNAIANTSASSCSERVKYEGEECSKELAQWQLCFLGPQDTGEIYLPAALGDQQESEDSASQILTYFHFLNPSPECVAAFRLFLCLERFLLCDASNELYQVTRADCVRLTTDVCKREFNIAANVMTLPSCDSFIDQKTQCSGKIKNYC